MEVGSLEDHQVDGVELLKGELVEIRVRPLVFFLEVQLGLEQCVESLLRVRHHSLWKSTNLGKVAAVGVDCSFQPDQWK